MTGKQIKSLIGIYAASMNIMGILIPVSILAAVAQAFPDVPMAMVQMIVSIPSILAIASNFIFAGLSHKLYRKTSIIISTCIFIVGGILPYFSTTTLCGSSWPPAAPALPWAACRTAPVHW
ncbi:hypothetical protein [Paratractidigestivibacter faecalis]|uniref:hypothetical protein n=1 Tax=Paratractidigestivibacter faecalis TaxID=2292441 RepID=UPI003A8FC97E